MHPGYRTNFLKIGFLAITLFSVVFLIFAYFYFNILLIEYKLVNSFISEANSFPVQSASADEVILRHSEKIKKEDIDWAKIKNIFWTQSAASEPLPSTGAENNINSEKIRVEIQNGTQISGLAKRAEKVVIEMGYEVIKIGNVEKK